jgi:hypothetical protein
VQNSKLSVRTALLHGFSTLQAEVKAAQGEAESEEGVKKTSRGGRWGKLENQINYL